ncbi:ATP-binding domain-containing protein [Streptomyces diacarni]|uniref:HelD family protein n=1 Tax=Streptomyces diacarni TaxID=2800381 RepID=UPI0033E78B8D
MGNGPVENAGTGNDAVQTYRERELKAEQEYVSTLYDRLDTLRGQADEQLREVHRRGGDGGTYQSRVERESLEEHYTGRLSQLSAAEQGLCFGRLDMKDGESLHVGRISMADEDYEPLLVDWRAPAAEGFYRATPATPRGVRRRRQIRTKDRTVIGVDDDVFELDELSDAERSALNGESALFAALTASRTGRMHDIVSTIQGEQDRIIRSELSGILVVQGGPGTGKTVVALHRAAYLLYTHRDRLAKRGVLVIGPNPTFMRYIDQVLPSLGENDVLLSSVGQLFPGIEAAGQETPEAVAVKGDPRMAGVLANAVRNLQRLPDEPITLTVNRNTVHQQEIRLTRALCSRARDAARETRQPHNHARRIFIKEIIDGLTKRLASKLGQTFRPEDTEDLSAELLADADVQAAVKRLWPEVSPQRLLTALYADPKLLADASPELTEAERAALLRPQPEKDTPENLRWTPADVPLLDEAAEQLGHVKSAEERRADQVAAHERQEAVAYAKEALGEMGIKMVSSEQLVAQYEGGTRFTSTADRARADRTWAFGHVIIDEAQELSPMAWRVLMRRCPSRSMTVVGDIAQTGSMSGARSWSQVLDPYARDRWRQEHLSMNYRTPSEIMEVASDVLREIDENLVAPTAVRSSGVPPWSLPVESAALTDVVARTVREELAGLGDGRLAVITPPSCLDELSAPLRALGSVTFADDPEALDTPAVVLTVEQAKGLEFDSVLVVEPQEILSVSPNGAKDLYVALTRATKRLGIVHTGQLPDALARAKPLSR